MKELDDRITYVVEDGLRALGMLMPLITWKDAVAFMCNKYGVLVHHSSEWKKHDGHESWCVWVDAEADELPLLFHGLEEAMLKGIEISSNKDKS